MSVRRIKISGHLLDSFLRDSELWESSLPWDVHVVGIAGEDDEPPQSFVLLAESNYFPSIADGHLIPFIEPIFTRKPISLSARTLTVLSSDSIELIEQPGAPAKPQGG